MENKERLLTKPLSMLALGHAITDLSQGALPVLLPFAKAAFGLTYAQVGFIVLMQNFTSSVIQPMFGYITDRISLPWLLPISVLLSGLGMAATGLAPSYPFLLAFAIIGGLGIAGFHPQASKSANFVSSKANKGRSMGIFSVGGNLGMATGSVFMTFLLGLPGVMDNTIYYVIPALLMAALFWFNLESVSPEMQKHPAANAQDALQEKHIDFRLLTILLTFIFVRSSIHTGLTTYIPLYYVDFLSGSPVYASYLVSIFLLSGVVGTYIGATMSDKVGRKKVIITSMVLSLPLIAAIPYTSGMITIIMISITGAVLISSFATTVVYAQEMMPGYVGMASGLTIGFSVGLGGIGATLLGYLADHFGIPSVFSVLAILPAMGALLAAFLPSAIKRRTASAA